MNKSVSIIPLLAFHAGLSLLPVAAGAAEQAPASPTVNTFKEADLKPSKSDKFTRNDRRFLVRALQINHNESVIAQLVAERAGSSEVKTLARQLVADFGESGRDGRLLAEHKEIPVPEPRSESGDLKSWNEKKPESLDQDYVNRARSVLKELVDLYTKAADKSDDPEIAKFARKLLPSAREQLQAAEKITPVHP